ncbi:hypothetical protein RF11_02218 [Thelohanellus kitauei]|uniref:Vigilin n=1 Tax=Thelohanellus kitauei TaxID=669202 RepID=A0A0C2MGB5_THEKT|nr:hypothetical protein RF11_02218 [Thelohanellus kitauei]
MVKKRSKLIRKTARIVPLNIRDPVKPNVEAGSCEPYNPCIVNIIFSDRRYKKHYEDFVKMASYVSNTFNLNLTFQVKNINDLCITFKSNGPYSAGQVRFILRETFSVQKYISIPITNNVLKRLSDDEIIIDSLIKNLCTTVTIDQEESSLKIEGGPDSVDSATQKIREYIKWNSDLVLRALDIPVDYHSRIKGSLRNGFDQIMESGRKYVDVAFEKPTKNQILLTGNSECVDNMRDFIMTEYCRYRNTSKISPVDLSDTTSGIHI